MRRRKVHLHPCDTSLSLRSLSHLQLSSCSPELHQSEWGTYRWFTTVVCPNILSCTTLTPPHLEIIAEHRARVCAFVCVEVHLDS